MDIRRIIAGLRKGDAPSAQDITQIATGLADGSMSDAQAGAFAMAVCWRGLSTQARSDLTLAMRDTGAVLQWDLDGPVVDKHSTGGVGDCVSLLLAPALSACGGYVPMISGRGLGHTGGTLDKLEAVPGVNTQVSQDRLVQMMQQVGCAIVGANADIAPADKRLYAVRDVTATVESLDLITASILSKKLAASPDVLVLDVKVGSGAFMKTQAQAQALARSLVETANAAGCRTSALITDMNQPLVPVLGNALEVRAVMDILTGGSASTLVDITAELGGALLTDAGLAADERIGQNMIRAAIADGRAADRFCKMVHMLGGPPDFGERWQQHMPAAPVTRAVLASHGGYVTAIEGEDLGHCVVRLGGGRLVESDEIDPTVGLTALARLGAKVERGDVIAVVHAADEEDAAWAADEVARAITLAETPGAPPVLIHDRIR